MFRPRYLIKCLGKIVTVISDGSFMKLTNTGNEVKRKRAVLPCSVILSGFSTSVFWFAFLNPTADLHLLFPVFTFNSLLLVADSGLLMFLFEFPLDCRFCCLKGIEKTVVKPWIAW